jgi:hypothetical protein
MLKYTRREYFFFPTAYHILYPIDFPFSTQFSHSVNFLRAMNSYTKYLAGSSSTVPC